MKKQKLKRRTYRPVSKKIKTVKKVVWRILFVLICAVALCVFSVYLGSWLKERAAQIDGILSPDDTTGTESATHETLPPTPESPVEAVPVCAAYLDVLGKTEADIEEYVYNLHESYNTVSINITSDDGKLVYVSPALLEYVKLDPSNVTAAPIVGNTDGGEGDTHGTDVFSNIKTALAAAKRRNLRACAVYSTSSAVLQNEGYEGVWEVDSVIVKELYELGFDEVMIDGLFAEENSFDVERVNRAVAYTANLKEKAGDVGVGLVLPEEAILVSSNASIVNTLCGYTDFLCMHVRGEGIDAEEVYSVTYEEFHSVKGALNAYKVRAVVLDEDADMAAAIGSALRDLASVSVQFMYEVELPIYSVETEEDTVHSEPTDTAYNENANRKEDYTNDTEYEEGTSVDTDAPDESGEGGEG